MKSIITVFLVLLTAVHAEAKYIFQQTGCTTDSISSAAQDLENVKQKAAAGEKTEADIAQAATVLKETVFCNEAPYSYSETCETLQKSQQHAVDEFRKELQIALRTYQEYGAELSKLGAIYSECPLK